MQNFPFTHNGQELWYSRSLAVSLCTFAAKVDEKDKLHVYVLANMRGPGAEFNKYMWNVPGGFIDFNENAETCGARETFEETGVIVEKDKIFFNTLDTNPTSGRQTMLASYFTYVDDIDKATSQFSLANSEPDEVLAIKFIDVTELGKYRWTRNQKEFIIMCLTKFIEQGLYSHLNIYSCKEEFENILSQAITNSLL